MPLAIRLDKTLRLAPEQRHVSRDDYQQLQNAQAIVIEAQKIADQIKRNAEENARKIEQEGYQKGIDDAKRHMAEKTIMTINKTIDYMTAIEERIIIIVTDAINKMLHQMPEQDLLRGIVHACLSHARGQQRMSLRVHPSQADGNQTRTQNVVPKQSVSSLHRCQRR